MKANALAVIATLLLGLGVGCGIVFPGGVLSSFVLSPETTCEQLSDQLGLGDLPDADTPADVGLQFEAFTVESTRGRQLSAWFVPAQYDGQLDADPVGTVLILHGTDGTIACTLPWVTAAAANHMHVVTFDYQGFGDSEGKADLATLLADSEAVLGWILGDDAPARQAVHLFGTSLGTGPALGLASLPAYPQIRSVVLDGAYDPVAMLQAIGEVVPTVLSVPIRLTAHLDFRWLFAMRKRLDDMTVPAMFLHAENDFDTPLAGAQSMFDRVGSPAKTFWVFHGLTHIQPLFLAEQEYVSLVVTFWRDPTAEPSPAAAADDETIRVPEFAL